MPLQKLQFRPGVNREGTNYSNEGGWFECDKIRFRSGFPEKLGGWSRATQDYTYQGVCRAMINWVDLKNNNLVGIGTHLKYYVNSGMGVYHDITPIRATQAGLSNPFTTISGSGTVTVTDALHGSEAGDFVTFTGATGFNGVASDTLNSEFQITRVIDVNSYEIVLPNSSVANASGSGGGTVTAAYQLQIGYPAAIFGNGFGAGVWNGPNVDPLFNTTLTYTSGATPWVLLNDTSTTINVGSTTSFPASGTLLINAELITYSGKTSTSFTGCTRGTGGSTAAVHAYRPTTATPTPITVYSVTGAYGTTGWGDAVTGGGVGVAQQMRIWTNDNYGENLLMAPRGGSIYYWKDNPSTWDRATLLSDEPGAVYVPTETNQVLVSDVSRFAIAFGATPYPSGDFDPMLVRWSDQENPLDWNEANYTTQTGSQRLSNGSYIMQAKKNRQEILIWTDSALYSMQYLGPPYVWGFQMLMDNISIMGPNSAIVVNNVAYWMGTDKFYMYSGTVQTLPCSLRQYVFEDISYDQRYQTIAGTNEGYNEVWWFYVSQTEADLAVIENRAPLIDKYVVYNHLERIWYYGSMRRTYWLDSGLQQWPVAAEPSLAIGTTNTDANHTSAATGTMVFHEKGVDDGSSATPVPFGAYISSSDFDIGDGHNFGYVWRIIPDVNFSGSTSGYPSVAMQVSPRDFSGSPYTQTDITDTVSAQNYNNTREYVVQLYTQQVYSRLRGRQMSFRIGSDGQLGVAWQLGSPRIDIRNDGRR